MIESHLEVGPFTPQELEEVCEALKSRGATFEILKDEQTEKQETRPDFANLVNKAEYRTEVYLGQIFYLRIGVAEFHRHEDLFQKYGMATTTKEAPSELEATGMDEVHEEAQTQKLFQSWVARGIVFLILVLWLWSYFNS